MFVSLPVQVMPAKNSFVAGIRKVNVEVQVRFVQSVKQHGIQVRITARIWLRLKESIALWRETNIIATLQIIDSTPSV